ncbi:MAG: hypothetical protein ACFFCX_07170 [Candidatus Sifarchaeia archaeon]
MDVPSQLRWIGPLIGVLYIILWLRRGLAPFWGMTVFSLRMLILNPLVLFLAIVLFACSLVAYRHWIASGIFFLSLFFSGILIQPLSVGYPLLITPSIGVFLIFDPSSWALLPILISMLSLIVLAILTLIVTGLVVNGKVGTTLAMLFYVIIITCWTFTIIPESMYMESYELLTPIPLGPLVALNILPLIPEKIASNQSQIIEDENQA